MTKASLYFTILYLFLFLSLSKASDAQSLSDRTSPLIVISATGEELGYLAGLNCGNRTFTVFIPSLNAVAEFRSSEDMVFLPGLIGGMFTHDTDLEYFRTDNCTGDAYLSDMLATSTASKTQSLLELSIYTDTGLHPGDEHPVRLSKSAVKFRSKSRYVAKFSESNIVCEQKTQIVVAHKLIPVKFPFTYPIQGPLKIK